MFIKSKPVWLAYFLFLIASIGFLREILNTGYAEAIKATAIEIIKMTIICKGPKSKIVTSTLNFVLM